MPQVEENGNLEKFFLLVPEANASGYGTDPNLMSPAVPWARTLSIHERAVAAALADTILPAVGELPPPSGIGIADFLDEWVSAPYPRQQSDRELIVTGLEKIDTESRRVLGLGFVDLTEQQKRSIVDLIANPSAPENKFFRRFRYLVVGGYYTSDIGFSAIGYVGNIGLGSYPTIPVNVQDLIEEELKKLGL